MQILFIILTEVHFIRVNPGSTPQFKYIRSASSFGYLLCGFKPTLFCPDPVHPSWRKTLSIYGPLPGSLAAHTGFITLSCSPLNFVCITFSLSASGSSLCDYFANSLVYSLLGLLYCVCSPLINEPLTWTKEEKAGISPNCFHWPTFPLSFFPERDILFSTEWLLWINACHHFPSKSFVQSSLFGIPTLFFFFYLRVKRSSGFHLRQKVGQRVKLFIETCLLLKHSLAEEEINLFT